jgi:hypothetical protein
MARLTLNAVSGETLELPFNTLDTVATETSAFCATSLIVAILPPHLTLYVKNINVFGVIFIACNRLHYYYKILYK